MDKKVLTMLLLAMLLVMLSISTVLAITASIGNSRMVLRTAPGEAIERSILVKNVNDVSVVIELNKEEASETTLKLKDETFTLQPKEEKKTFFTIKSDKTGTTESKINVRFIPEEGNGVGLSSTIILIVSDSELDDEQFRKAEDNEPELDNEDGQSVSFNPTGYASNINPDTKSNISPATILIITSFILVVIFLSLIFFYINKNTKKGIGRSNE